MDVVDAAENEESEGHTGHYRWDYSSWWISRRKTHHSNDQWTKSSYQEFSNYKVKTTQVKNVVRRY